MIRKAAMLCYEHVDPAEHPQWYRSSGRPRVAAADVPDQYWRQVVQTGGIAESGYHWVAEREYHGDLVRDVNLIWYWTGAH